VDNHNEQIAPKEQETVNRIVKKRGKVWAWAFFGFAVVYFISPVDLVPDFLPVIGWVDDAAVGIAAIINLVAKYRAVKTK